jgi:hypothetical protein
MEDRDRPLVVGHSVIDLLSAVNRSRRIRTNDENEVVGGFDVGEDFLLPLCRQRNVFPVDPSLALPHGQGRARLAHEVLVLARIRNEDL